eukprot:CAMPEP_0185039098 /NCGR_PEP_ID=MMETSP1103-20130426/35595_1 /TAXON_ID=36769 /ORGANISM="Paraphysomonas bandaiensis, Strain Caron Lab Isolate" /LENGTH=964 /DNA_ID=CAMNT_0027577857 /DNA_START=417 /DNA_END=3311 /DNA_ORIENTATION=-
MRALCFSLLGQLAETESVSDFLKPHTKTISDMILAGCGDASHDVAVAAMSAATVFIGALSDSEEVMHLKGVLSPLLEVMQKCLQTGDEEVVTEGLEMLQESVAMDLPLINDHVQYIVPFTISIMGNFDLESSTRSAAGQTIMSIIELRPKLLSKLNMVEPILQVFVEAIAKSDCSGAGTLFTTRNRPLEEEDDDDDEDYTLAMESQEIAQMCLDRMALSISSKAFVGPALNICSQCMESADKNMRKAGCAVLGIISEGCCDAIKEMLPAILPRLLHAVQDAEYFVRESACFALGQFSEHCQPEILYHHQAILPVVFAALDDPRNTVQGTSCYVLENFCENLQSQTLLPFLPMLMERLIRLLHNPKKSTQEMALAAISATAVASEIHFLPYANAIVEVLKPVLFSSEPMQFSIRGRALECLGHIAVALGGEHFAPYFEMGMRSTMQGVQIDEDELKEYSYTYIANCAKVMKNVFDQYLSHLVPHLLDVIRQPELSPYTAEPDTLDSLNDDEEDEGGEENYHLTVDEGFINTKKAAICAIGSLADHTGAAFFPYLEDTLNVMLAEQNGVLWSFHRIIRAEALLNLQYFLKVSCLSNGMVEPPAKGKLVQIDPVTKRVSEAVFSTYINAMVSDVEKLPAAYAIEGLESCVGLLGVACLTLVEEESKRTYGDLIMHNILALLKEKAKCQTVFQHEEEDDDQDHDNLVMDAVCDLVATLAKVVGADFLPYFEQFAKPLLKFTKKNRSYTDRAMAIGCFAEVVSAVGPSAGAMYAETLLPVVRAGVADSMENVRRNSAYALGVLCENAMDQLSPSILQILQWIYPLCVRESTEVVSDVGGADIDNALAAVARMIMAAPSAVPLGQVLPVLISALPLRSDFGEGLSIYTCLAGLVKDQNPDALSLLPRILVAFAQALEDGSQYTDETKVIVISCIKYLSSNEQYREVFSSAHGSLQDQPAVMHIIDAASKS